MNIARGILALVAAVIALSAAGPAGCAVISGKFVVEEPFTDKQVARIRNYYTTKAEILAWFGPPAAIARRGAVLTVPPAGPGKRGSREVPPEEFLAPFAAKHELTADHVVYYYHDSSVHRADIVFLFGVFPTTPEMRVRKLWVLINGKNGIVEDSLLAAEKQKEPDQAWARSGQEPKKAAGAAPGNNGETGP